MMTVKGAISAFLSAWRRTIMRKETPFSTGTEGVVSSTAFTSATSWSTSAREAGDISAGVFDLKGQMLAQAVTGTPGHINSMALAVPHVLEVHDLHASQITSGLPVLSAHVVVEDACFYDGHVPQVLDQLQACLAEHFPVSVEHSTFQLESPAHASHELASHD